MMRQKFITLEETTGLSDDDPIHTYLKLADKCLGSQCKRSWYEIHRVVPVIDLLTILWHFLGHPVSHREPPTTERLRNFIDWLNRAGEVHLARLYEQLYASLGTLEIRLVMLYIMANLGLLKEQEDKLRLRRRCLDDDWFGIEKPPDTEWKSYLQPPEKEVE